MAASRYTAEIDLQDVRSSHALAVLGVTPGSSVLDIGAADGSVARSLVERGCRVVGIEADAEAARAAEAVCARVVVGDVETLDLDAALESERFDFVLLLDVIEHLREPLAVLKAAAGMVQSGGRIIISVPNVTHAALRLQLLAGRFQYTEKGLLDQTHLRFFDRPGLERLINQAGLGVVDRMRTIAGITETEVQIDPDSFPPEVVELAQRGEDADTYQFIYVLAPGSQSVSLQNASLGEALQRRAIEAERLRAEAEAYARTLEGRIAELELEREKLVVHEAEARERASLLERELRERMSELERVHDELRHVQMDVSIKVAQLAYVQAELAPLRRRLDHAEDVLGSTRRRLVRGVGRVTSRVPTLHRLLKRIAHRRR